MSFYDFLTLTLAESPPVQSGGFSFTDYLPKSTNLVTAECLMDIDKDRIFEIMIWLLVLVCMFGISFGSCQFFNRQFQLEDDNVIEEAIEALIEHKTGVSLDLTPESKEQD